MKTTTTAKTVSNSFAAKLNRFRSVPSVLTLLPGLRDGVENPKTVRRRRRLLTDKLSALGVMNIVNVLRGKEQPFIVAIAPAAKAKRAKAVAA